MNLTTSLWTTPMDNGRWDIKKQEQFKHTLMMCGLCVTHAKNNGAHITMHCDSQVASHLENFGYDDIIIDLNDLQIKKSDSTVMWAAGKFIALAKEPLGTIHIDNDVFLKSERCIKEMEFEGYDFICQNVENCNYPEKTVFKDLIPTVNMNVDYACCVGVIGFNNQKLLNDYINHYMYYVENLEFDKKDNNKINADLVLEQIYLYNRLDKYNCKFLIGDIRVDHMNTMQKKAMDLKYEHVLGPTKYIPYILKRMYNELEIVNPKIYNYVMSL